jgi:hypothetical protein
LPSTETVSHRLQLGDGVAVDDRPFLVEPGVAHRFEERGLCLRRRAVGLVGEHDVRPRDAEGARA